MKKGLTEEHIVGLLRKAESGLPVADLCRRHGLSEAAISSRAIIWWHERYSPALRTHQLPQMRLKGQDIALVQRRRRYGASLIYLKLRRAGEIVNHKRVDRLYAQAGLQVKKRKRKKISLAERHPLERPLAANQVWSMDSAFDRKAERRGIKKLTVVDDATHEAVAIVPERAMGGNQLVRILDQLAFTRGLPKAIRTDNGKEFCSRVMLNWAHSKGCSCS